jgi:hypothetical protein
MVGGGSSFNNLNGMYSVQDPAGTAAANEPVLKTMQCLKQFVESFDFMKMQPDRSFVKSGLPAAVYYRGMSERGKQYALYHHHCVRKPYVYQAQPGAYRERLTLDLPGGTYQADWVDPSTGVILEQEKFTHAGGQRVMSTPQHKLDVALRIKSEATDRRTQGVL